MTTIIITPTAIYADTGMYNGNFYEGEVDKIVRKDDAAPGWMTAAGSYAVAADYLEKSSFMTPYLHPCPENISAFGLTDDGKMWFADGGGCWHTVRGVPYAIGGGGGLMAMGALAAGANPIDAMRATLKHYVFMSSTIHVAHIREREVEVIKL